MRAARKLLGLPVTRKWTEQRAIAALKKLAQAGNLRYSYLERHTPALLSAVDRLWGGWTAGLKAAGVFASKVDRRKWTRKSILDILKKESRREIHTLKDRYGSGIYPGAIREFGSWGSALRAAGIPVHRT
jgi:hypothetical protein